MGDTIKKFSVVRLDNRGRILIPYGIRKNMNFDKKSRCLVLTMKNEIIVSPIKQQDAALKIIMKDVPGSLAGVARVISKKGINIVTSQSRTLESGKMSEWDVVLDAPKNNLKKLEKSISKLKNIEEIFVE